jgi:hypothetical protein
VVFGDQRQAIYHVDQLAAMLGIAPDTSDASYPMLVNALERVLAAIERAVRQVPPEHLGSPTPNRGRDIRELAYNIHDPIRGLAASLDSGVFDWRTEYDYERSRGFGTVEDLAGFCRSVRISWVERARRVDPDEAARPVSTERGELTNAKLLEAQAIHAARHLGDVYGFLREIGVEPADELDEQAIAPIPVRK